MSQTWVTKHSYLIIWLRNDTVSRTLIIYYTL